MPNVALNAAVTSTATDDSSSVVPTPSMTRGSSERPRLSVPSHQPGPGGCSRGPTIASGSPPIPTGEPNANTTRTSSVTSPPIDSRSSLLTSASPP